MDNQHDLDSLGYLAGFIDGDGCLRLSVNGVDGYKTIIPSIEICNTNESAINYCCSVLSEHGVKYNRFVNSKTGGKPYHIINLRSQRRCKKLLNLITPFLVAKRNKAKIIADFIGWRHSSSRDYTDRDWAFVDRFREVENIGYLDSEENYQLNHGYVAGILDAEGTISLKGGYRKKHGQLAGINPHIRFANTDHVLVRYMVYYFQQLGSNPHIYKKKIKSGKIFVDVTVNGLAKTKRVLDVIYSLLVAKKAQASIVLDFVRHRLSLAEIGEPKKNYSEYELGLVKKIQAMNG